MTDLAPISRADRGRGVAEMRVEMLRNKRNPAETTAGFQIDPNATDQGTTNTSHSTGSA